MNKGITIFLGVMIAALMLTSLFSAVHSEITIAQNAALIVKSQPVIASDTTISEIEPEKYDSMIKGFYLDESSDSTESDQNKALSDSTATEDEQALPAVADTKEAEAGTTVAIMNEVNDSDIIGTQPPGTSDESSNLDTTAALANDDDSLQSDDALPAAESDMAIEAEALHEQDLPAVLHAAVDNNDSVIEPESPGGTDNNTVFTIQAGSYTVRINAEDHYNSLMQSMNETDIDNLRIEKVGEYYTVRLGRFDHYVTAMKFLNAMMNSQLSSAIVLNAYIKDERIFERIILSGK